jgi:hypothetical protein
VTAWQLTWSEIALETPTLVKHVEEHAAELLEAALASVDHGRGTGVEVSGEWVNGHASTGPRGASISVRNLMSSSRRHGKQLCVAAESVDECSPAGLVDSVCFDS